MTAQSLRNMLKGMLESFFGRQENVQAEKKRLDRMLEESHPPHDGSHAHGEDIIDKVHNKKDLIDHVRQVDHDIEEHFLFHKKETTEQEQVDTVESVPVVEENDKTQLRQRSKKGTIWTARDDRGSLAEGAAAIALVLPLVILCIFVVMEASKGYVLYTAVTDAANRASRAMTIAYWQDDSVATDRSLQNSMVYDQIRVAGVIADSRQFDDAVFDTQASPPMVTVTVHYTGGLYGLPVFPKPDPLRLGNTFTITGTATQALE